MYGSATSVLIFCVAPFGTHSPNLQRELLLFVSGPSPVNTVEQ